MNNSISENKNHIIKLLFLIQFFVALIKIDTNVFSTIYYYEQPVQTRVELVVSEGQSTLPGYCKLLFPSNKIVNVPFSVIDYATLHKYALHYYDNYLLIHYKSIENNFIPHKQLLSILQRKNPGDQSNDKVPLHLG